MDEGEEKNDPFRLWRLIGFLPRELYTSTTFGQSTANVKAERKKAKSPDNSPKELPFSRDQVV